jgi:hypothetical protein
MSLPFSIDEFFKVFENYNNTVWPMQYFLVLLAVIAIFMVIKKTKWSTAIIGIILSFLWLWMGVVYHLVFFTSINKVAYIFGGAFILQSFLFLHAFFFSDKLSFHFKKDIFGLAGIVFVLFALVIYPIIGYYNGHMYHASPTFGLPCPTTIFTFGILLLTEKKCPPYIFIIPLLWSTIGTSAAFSLNVEEDISLLVAGITFAFLLFIKNKRRYNKTWTPSPI